MNTDHGLVAVSVVILAVGLIWSTTEAVLWWRATRKEHRNG